MKPKRSKPGPQAETLKIERVDEVIAKLFTVKAPQRKRPPKKENPVAESSGNK